MIDNKTPQLVIYVSTIDLKVLVTCIVFQRGRQKPAANLKMLWQSQPVVGGRRLLFAVRRNKGVTHIATLQRSISAVLVVTDRSLAPTSLQYGRRHHSRSFIQSRRRRRLEMARTAVLRSN